MAQNLMASIAFSQTVMVSLPMMAEIAQMTVIAIHQTYRNGFHFYESRKGQNYVEGCNSQQIDRNGFYSYENRNGFSSSRNGLFPSQGHIGYHQGRNGYAQTFNNPQQHADKIMEINQTTIILVRILIMSMGGQRQTNKEIPTLLSVDARSQNLDFRYSLGRETGSPSFCNLSCWRTDTIGPWTGGEKRSSFA